MASFFPRYDILPSAQKKLLTSLTSVCQNGFVLYGGTAIALRLGHRESIDFDFFSEYPFETNALFQKFNFLDNSTVIQEASNTLTVLTEIDEEYVKLSFFGNLNFGRVGNPEWTSDGTLLLASLDDLLALKLAVLLKRVEVKDYKDISVLLKSGFSLSKGLASAKLFYPKFQPNEALKALVYFEEGDLDTLSETEKSILIEAVQDIKELPRVTLLSHSLIE